MLTPMFHRSEEVDEAGMVGLLGANEQLKIFQFCLYSILYMRAKQSHSVGDKFRSLSAGQCGNLVELDSIQLSDCSHHDCKSIIKSGLIAEAKDTKEGRQTVFFTAVDPMSEPKRDEPYKVHEPQEVLYRMKWEFYQRSEEKR